MDPSQRTSGALLDRANADIAQLLRRFENILAYTADDKHDRVSAAVGAYQMEVETAALVKAAEDILSLTRTLKETWLFGKLQTVGTSEAETRAHAAAAKVAEGLKRHNEAFPENSTAANGANEDGLRRDGDGTEGGHADSRADELITGRHGEQIIDP